MPEPKLSGDHPCIPRQVRQGKRTREREGGEAEGASFPEEARVRVTPPSRRSFSSSPPLSSVRVPRPSHTHTLIVETFQNRARGGGLSRKIGDATARREIPRLQAQATPWGLKARGKYTSSNQA